MTDKLTDLIDEMVEQKTFNLDALNAIKALRDGAKAQDAKIGQLNTAIEARDKTIRSQSTETAEISEKLRAFREREKDLEERESRIREIELRESASTARAGALSEVFQTIFRNASVRENTTRHVPYRNTQPGGYTTEGTMPVTDHSERTTE